METASINSCYIFRNSLLDYLCRALSCALAAVGALGVIDDCYVVLHMDCVELTLFGTQGTSDTSSLTCSLYIFALVMAAALY